MVPSREKRAYASRENSARAAGQAVLASTVTVPRLPAWIVRRARIDRLITSGAEGAVTVLTGPPGAGKTVALAAWAAARPTSVPVAWVALDQYDNRPEMFWPAVTAALRQAGIAVPPDEDARRQGSSEVARGLATALATGDRDVTLVLDDLHHVSEPACLDGVEYLARYSGRLHVLVASRMDPLLHLRRLRLSGQLTEIRARDLAFTGAETGQLMAHHGIQLPAAAIEQLAARSEGWAAGLRLAALAMREQPDPARVIGEFSAADGPVAAYLVSEVLDRQPAEVRRLLLYTSVVDQVCDDLAGELAGGAGSTASLPALARANAFLQPAGNGWYRYYPPLAAVLRLKLREEHPEQVRPLRLRAAHWLSGHGALAEAVSLAVTVDDWALGAWMAVEELATGGLVDPTASHRLADVLARRPASLDGGTPHSLVAAAAIAARYKRMDEAGAMLRAAAAALDAIPADAELSARLGLATIELEVARRNGDLAAAQTAAAQARGILARLPLPLLERSGEARARVLSAVGMTELWADRFDAAAAAFELSMAAGSGSGWVEASANLALLAVIEGRLSQAAPASTSETDAESSRGAAAAVAAAWVKLDRGQLSAVGTELARAERAIEARPDPLLVTLAGLVGARYQLARGEPGQAAEIARQARSGWVPPAWLDELLAAAEVRACSELGDGGRALSAAAAAGGGPAQEPTPALAHAWLASGHLARAGHAVASAKAAAARRGWCRSRLEAELAEAELAYASGDPVRGRRSLGAALRLAEPEQLQLPFTLERGWLQPNLRRDPQLADAFRRAFASGPAGAVAGPSGARIAPPVIEQLSGREREVLGYLSDMLSTAEIAEEMYLSVNTVKSHLRTILRKLGASRRGEAVRRARELELL